MIHRVPSNLLDVFFCSGFIGGALKGLFSHTLFYMDNETKYVLTYSSTTCTQEVSFSFNCAVGVILIMHVCILVLTLLYTTSE